MCAGHSTREQQGHHRDPELNIEDAIQLFQGSKNHRDLLNLTITSTLLLEYTDSAKLNPNFWRIHPMIHFIKLTVTTDITEKQKNPPPPISAPLRLKKIAMPKS